MPTTNIYIYIYIYTHTHTHTPATLLGTPFQLLGYTIDNQPLSYGRNSMHLGI